LSATLNSTRWSRGDELYTVVCRPALPKDTQQVLDLTRQIWEGEDYVPYVWEEWLSDYEGMLSVVEYGGRVIGLGKLSLLAPGQWWLEGLRIHPEFQGRGIGSHLHNYLIERWLKIGDGVIRLVTGSSRLAVHHMSERTGFKKIGELTPIRPQHWMDPQMHSYCSRTMKYIELRNLHLGVSPCG
jgi:GNAT superfamily N-acetyltransferase